MPSLGLVDRSISAGAAANATIKQNTGRQCLFIQNNHATAIIWVSITGGATAVVATVAGAGFIRVGPAGGTLVFENSFVPTSAVSIISDTATTPVTILEG
jgi:hypothetical protein